MSDSPVLILNAGSSSLKYQLVVPETAEVQARSRSAIGEPGSPTADHAAAMQTMQKDLAAEGIDLDAIGLRAVGHRVVHGGPDFSDPTIIDDAVLAEIKDLIPLAPLHNPGACRALRLPVQNSRYRMLRSSIRHSSAPCRRQLRRTRYLVILLSSIGSGATASMARPINLCLARLRSWWAVILVS